MNYISIEDVNGNAFVEFIDLISAEPLQKYLDTKMSKENNSIKKEEKDHEHSMARTELKTAQDAIKRIQKKMKGEGNIEAWVQSKITRASEYLDTAADYLDSGEHKVDEAVMPPRINKDALKASQKQEKIRIKATDPKENPNVRDVAKTKLRASNKVELFPTTKVEEISLVDKILSEIEEEKKGLWANIHARRQKGLPRKKPGQKGYPETLDIEEGIKQARKNVGASKCWTGKKLGNPSTKMKDGKEVPNCVPESIEHDKDPICPYCGCDPCECEGEVISEAIHIPGKTGNNIFVTLSWRGKYYSIQIFFPQAKVPSRIEISDEIQKIYPGSRMVAYRISEFKEGEPLVYAYRGANKNYVKPMGEEVEIDEAKKSEMPCNKPKAEAHGSGETGKSHVVKACENGKEKLIRFGQKGVKGSPKKKGESEEYASRRHRFQSRHAKNIAKGKMSAAYWANKVKW